MATNKELVEQAVGAIPKWMAFLDRKQAEQNLILEQMQDEETQFAPKTLTQKLTDRFRSKTEQPKPAETEITDNLTQVEPQDQQGQVKLEKEASEKKEEKAVEETPVPQEPDTDESNEPVSSDDDQQMLIDKKNFNDLF